MATSWKGAPKDPQDVKDYGINWTADLPTGVAIASGVFSISDGDVTIVQELHDDTHSTVRLAGGTVGTAQLINCHIIMDDGEELDVDVSLAIKERVVK